jgi:hypothetical protein
MSEPVSEPIYEVAVSTDPLLWVIHCELCNEEFGTPTDSDSLLELFETEHKKAHGLN